ncbi:MAG: CHAP domain-containing protein [Rhizomicrobium sp.]
MAKGKRRWLDAKPQATIPKPGWLVIYNFGKGADHVGIVESATGASLSTIEFNTTTGHGSQRDGGKVARRTRRYDKTVKGFINTTA